VEECGRGTRLRHTNEFIGATTPQVLRFISIAISTGYKRKRSIATQILSNIEPGDEPKLIEKKYRYGGMTSELRPIEYISEFVSGRPTTMRTGRSIPRLVERKRYVNSRP